MKKINVEKIMKEITKKAKDEYNSREEKLLKVTTSSNMLDCSFDYEQFNNYINELKNMKLNYYNTFAPKGFMGFMKKVIRKIIKPICYPLIKKQQKYNETIIRIVNQLSLYIQEQKNK